MNRGKRKSEHGDGPGGRFFMLPHCLLNSEAFRSLQPRAKAVLLALCSQHTGFNNGSIGLSFRKLAELVDSQNNSANSRALCQLIERGIVALECDHPRGKRLAREYRLTFVNTGDIPATNEYLHWQPGDAGTHRKRETRNFRVAGTEAVKAAPVAAAITGGETSRCGTLNGGDAKLQFLDLPPVDDASPHINNHLGVDRRFPSPLRANPHRQPSAAPDPEDLRWRAHSALAGAERGTQGKLAALAQIRPAALSKFLNNAGSLNDASRVRLTLALPNIANFGSHSK